MGCVEGWGGGEGDLGEGGELGYVGVGDGEGEWGWGDEDGGGRNSEA